ncbi:Rrf2 family transcriptional regulator [Nitratidesulfovibrio sp. HK-II]|uniref:RrF2 family transcriptional regulator n=1 Tax=Nitratidesulfovibrio sp. HK-II TaxID=2009266 RepID=UPI000E2EBD4D|nr:Rrf2 family transcriptional regulator [Nitratidesulfovibrio sp. HK-II]GBO96925.1 Rrf2 family transcriptional regulator [Nitratidesulfovibrio sp. HK-II]
MRLLTNSRYGTRMMLDIAQHSRLGPVLMRDVARRLDVSQKYLEKISRSLKEAGLLVSQRGPNGGHRLGRSPDDISVGDVVRVLEGGAEMVGCGRDEEHCTHAPGCLTRMVWKEGSRAMFARLDAITFGELLRYVDQGVKFGDWCTGTVAEHREEAERELRALAGFAESSGYVDTARFHGPGESAPAGGTISGGCPARFIPATPRVPPSVSEPCEPEGPVGLDGLDGLDGRDERDGPDDAEGVGTPRTRPARVS